MPTHRVQLKDMPTLELNQTRVTFRVERDGKLLGQLHVERSGISWQPSQRSPKRMTWEKLNSNLFDETGK